MPIDAYRRDLRVFAFIFFIFSFFIVIFVFMAFFFIIAFFFIMAFFFFIMVIFFFIIRFVILPPDPKKPLTLLYNFPTTLLCAPLGRGALWGTGIPGGVAIPGVAIPGVGIPGGGGSIPGGGGADILL